MSTSLWWTIAWMQVSRPLASLCSRCRTENTTEATCKSRSTLGPMLGRLLLQLAGILELQKAKARLFEQAVSSGSTTEAADECKMSPKFWSFLQKLQYTSGHVRPSQSSA
eukprot:5366887-Amphidinium_carterae.1